MKASDQRGLGIVPRMATNEFVRSRSALISVRNALVPRRHAEALGNGREKPPPRLIGEPYPQRK